MKFLPKLIFLLVCVGVVFSLTKVYFVQNNMERLLQEEIFPWYYRVGFLGHVCILIASVCSFFMYHKYFPSYVKNTYLLIILLVLIVSFNDLSQYKKSPNFFFSTKGLGTFINFGILFFVADTKYFPKILKLFYALCFIVIVTSFINLAKVGFGANRKQFLYAVRDFTVFLMWVFPYYFMQDEADKKLNMLNMIGMGLILIIVLTSGSRSYLIIYLSYIMVKFWAQIKSKNGILVIAGSIIALVAGYFILINSGLAGTFDNAMKNLSERSGEDTRSEQIVEFLDQFDMNYLIQGVGPMKQWYWTSVGDLYSYLDNQFLLLCWWAGLPTLLAYLYFLIRPLFEKSEILRFENIKGTKMIIFWWIMACVGFAIYCPVNSDTYYYFISMMVGLTTCRYTLLIDEEDEEHYEDFAD
jgi:hypothetical protein